MAITENNLRQMTQDFSLVKSCDVVQNGMLRVATPFEYTDGSNIDLFIEGDLLQEVILTDMGQTAAYLLDLQVRPWSSKRREQAVADICDSLKVDRKGAEFYVRVPAENTQAFNQALVRLAQACIRVADLALTQRWRMGSAFRDDMEEFIDALDANYESPYKIAGRYANEVEVDFRTVGRTSDNLILTLSTQNAAAAHNLANEVFRKWYDLRDHQREFAFITTYDTTTNIFRAEDLQRLEDMSTVFGFPAQEAELAEAIAA